jgi:hypothetical protein
MVKRSKGFSKLLKQQRAEPDPQKSLEKLQEKISQSALSHKFAGVVMNPAGEAKMSEVLEDFIEPYSDLLKTRSEHENLIRIAIIAWNIALMPHSKQQSLINRFITHDLGGKDLLDQQATKKFINELIARKQALFAGNKRFIVDFQLQDQGKGFYLSVASTLSQPGMEQS